MTPIQHARLKANELAQLLGDIRDTPDVPLQDLIGLTNDIDRVVGKKSHLTDIKNKVTSTLQDMAASYEFGEIMEVGTYKFQKKRGKSTSELDRDTFVEILDKNVDADTHSAIMDKVYSKPIPQKEIKQILTDMDINVDIKYLYKQTESTKTVIQPKN